MAFDSNRRPSQSDVALRAGVSGQTVSRVVMGLDNVKPETRDRVLRAIAELGYAPNHAARALRTARLGTIGILVNGFVHSGEKRTVEAVISAAGARGISAVVFDLSNLPGGEADPVATRLAQHAVDGLIVVQGARSAFEDLHLPTTIPYVLSNSFYEGELPGVDADLGDGARAAVKHLLAQGHQTVTFISGPSWCRQSKTRENAWRAALTEAGALVPPVVGADWSGDSGYVAGQLVAQDPSVTAILCNTDAMAFGVLRALHDAGLRVPDDVSLVGCENELLSEQLWPPLTSVDLNFAAIGERLVDQLWRRVNGEPLEENREVTPVELVVRSSTAKPL